MRKQFPGRNSLAVVPLLILAFTTAEAGAQSFLERLEARLSQGAAALAEQANASEAEVPQPELEPATQVPAAEPAARPQVGRRGYLGLVGDETPDASGVTVAVVRPGSPAERAGLVPGDLIVAVDGAPVTQLDDVARALERGWVGSRVEFTVKRGEREQVIPVTLGERPGAASRQVETLPAPTDVPAAADSPPVLGVSLAEVSSALQQRYGFRLNKGAVITSVAPGTPAERYRLPIGAVIVDINGVAIERPQDVENLLREARADEQWEIAYFTGAQRYRTRIRLAPAAAPAAAPSAARQPLAPGSELPRGLGNRLEGGGRRPLLGRLGRVLDNVLAEGDPGALLDELAPADLPQIDEPPPAGPALIEPQRAARPQGENEVDLLREEVLILRQEVEELRRRLDALERKE